MGDSAGNVLLNDCTGEGGGVMKIAAAGGSGGADTGAVSTAPGKDRMGNEAGGVRDLYRGWSRDGRDSRCKRLRDA